METLENNTHIATLLSIYGNLLGEAELRRAQRHFFEDLSIAEIAQEENTSRNAIYLSLKSVKQKLVEYDNLLKLSEKEKKTMDLLDKIEAGVTDDKKKANIEEIRRIWSHGI